MSAARQSSTEFENSRVATRLVATLLAHGSRHFFIAPGSRCTPLTLAIANRSDSVVTQHFDERGLSYAALGFGRSTGACGIFVCTSGTAVANALPAVVESSLDHIPMLLMTADRPPELRDAGANQTIDQVKIFGSYPAWQFDLPCASVDITNEFLDGTIRHAIRRTAAGPVHLNCMFREPFPPTVGAVSTESHEFRSSELEITHKATVHVPHGNTIVTCGHCRPAAVAAARQLANRLACPFLCDTTSSLRDVYFDLALMRDDLPSPEVVIHVGGRIVSKRWSTFLTKHPPQHLILFTESPDRFDPLHQVTAVAEGDLVALCNGVDTETTTAAVFRTTWEQHSRQCRQVALRLIDGTSEITEPGLMVSIARTTPSGSAVMVGNSMPIRDLDCFGDVRGENDVRWFANRGASGIDGIIATGVGIAKGSHRPTTVVLGDLSALHDVNSLALVRQLEQPFVVVIVNNDGGGIFNFLPVAENTPHFESFFGTPHGLRFKGAAAMFGLQYQQPQTMNEFSAAYDNATKTSGPTIIEVRTDRQANFQFHRQIYEAVRSSPL